MSNSHNDGFSKDDWDDGDGFSWNEFDWERYLRDQDALVGEYLKRYEKLPANHERLDEAARAMGWEIASWSDSASQIVSDAETREASDEEDDDDNAPYTVHRNPVFVATRAIFVSLVAAVEKGSTTLNLFPPAQAVSLLAALNRCETSAMLGIHALDFCDYGLGVSELKRALAQLNNALASVNAEIGEKATPASTAFREYVVSRLFDLREIWLRVMAECRHELERPSPPESDASED